MMTFQFSEIALLEHHSLQYKNLIPWRKTYSISSDAWRLFLLSEPLHDGLELVLNKEKQCEKVCTCTIFIIFGNPIPTPKVVYCTLYMCLYISCESLWNLNCQRNLCPPTQVRQYLHHVVTLWYHRFPCEGDTWWHLAILLVSPWHVIRYCVLPGHPHSWHHLSRIHVSHGVCIKVCLSKAWKTKYFTYSLLAYNVGAIIITDFLKIIRWKIKVRCSNCKYL